MFAKIYIILFDRLILKSGKTFSGLYKSSIKKKIVPFYTAYYLKLVIMWQFIFTFVKMLWQIPLYVCVQFLNIILIF